MARWPFLAIYQFTCRVERTKGFFEKSVFWDRLFGTPCLSSRRGACQRKYTWMDLEATKGEQEEDWHFHVFRQKFKTKCWLRIYLEATGVSAHFPLSLIKAVWNRYSLLWGNEHQIGHPGKPKLFVISRKKRIFWFWGFTGWLALDHNLSWNLKMKQWLFIGCNLYCHLELFQSYFVELNHA